jgi:hypothetical protein
MIERAAAELGLDGATIDRIFEGAATDFDVIITPRLPFLVHRAGMAGITLGGRVYLHAGVRSYSPTALLLLLRHEAEHVAQQRREGLAFYARYAGAWLRGWARELLGRGGRAGEGRAGARHRAYMMIPAEREAYGAEARARALLGFPARR